MKKIFIIVAILIPIVFASCGGGGGSTSPSVFNNTAMKKFEAANKTLGQFDAKITEGVKSKDFASIAVAAESALKDVDVQLEEMKAINPPKGGEKYKEAVVKSLETVKEIIEVGKKYSTLKEGFSKSDFSALEKEYNKKRKQLSEELNNVASAQSEFAKAVNSK